MSEKWFWQPSAWQYAMRAGILLLALPAMQLARLPDWLYLAGHGLCLLYALYLLLELRKSRTAFAKTGLVYRQGGWQLWSSQHGWREIRLSGQTLVLPWLIIVYYRWPDGFRQRWLVVDRWMLGQDAHRRLRVRLRFAN